MKTGILIAAACAAATCVTAQAGPFDQFRGKLKDGMYEYKMNMEMPGLPPGMSKQNHTFQHCVTQKDMDEGTFNKSDRKGPSNCEIKDMKVAGNTATYTMECKAEKGRGTAMRADNKIVFGGDSFVMDMKMAMNEGGQAMNMTQHLEAHYLGPCTK
jgi:hypothetical protein